MCYMRTARKIAPGLAASRLVDPDLLVLELASRVSAGFCGSLLADLGASVFLAEGAEGDGGKWRSRPVIAAGKQSIDRSDPDDVLLERLLTSADVVLLSTDHDP